jgi:hypothetical protein
MATQAKASFPVEGQELFVVGVVPGRAVAVFALYPFVRPTSVGRYIILVAFDTGLPALILDRKVYPLLNI